MSPEQFAQFGIVGLVLFWFMWRSEKKTEQLTKAINNQTIIMMSVIDVIASCPNNNADGKRIKSEELQKIKTEILKTT